MSLRIAFDLDETLGTPVIQDHKIIGFNYRHGVNHLLLELIKAHSLILWTSSSRRYLDKILKITEWGFFEETYSWDELPSTWKNIQSIKADILIDDSEHHFLEAKNLDLGHHYLVLEKYGSIVDNQSPLFWVEQIKAFLAQFERSSSTMISG